MSDFIIKDWSISDIDAIANMHRLNFKDAWSKDMLLSSFNAQGFVGGLIEVDGQIACTVAFSSVLGEAELLSVVTRSNFRGLGLAVKLLTHYLLVLKTAGNVCAFLEVRASNTPAINLYKKLGFVLISERKNYYGTETALIFKKEL